MRRCDRICDRTCTDSHYPRAQSTGKILLWQILPPRLHALTGLGFDWQFQCGNQLCLQQHCAWTSLWWWINSLVMASTTVLSSFISWTPFVVFLLSLHSAFSYLRKKEWFCLMSLIYHGGKSVIFTICRSVPFYGKNRLLQNVHCCW